MTQTTVHPASAHAATKSTRPWPLLLIVGATILVFAPLCRHEFTWWDDWATVHQNPLLNPPSLQSIKYYWTHFAYGLYVPVTYTVWIGLASIARLSEPGEHNIALNPWMFHSANVLVHVISAVVAYQLLRRLVKHDAAACIGALLFALHPVQVETVGWVSGMKDLLGGCFGLIALLWYVKAQRGMGARPMDLPLERPRHGRAAHATSVAAHAIATLALAAALLAKPSAMMIPVIAAAIDRLVLQRPWRRVIRATALWFIMIIPVMVVARLAQDVQGIPKAPLWARPLVMGDAIAFYLYKLFVPLGLGVDYGRRPNVVIHQWWFYLTWLVPVAIAVLLWRNRKRWPWLVAAGMIFVAAILPVSGLATFQYQFTSTTADHYLYLAMLGPALALAFVLREYGSRALWTIAIIAIALLGVRSFAQTPAWRDDGTLFSHALKVNPDSGVAYNNLGLEYKRQGDADRALEYFKRAMQLAPDHPNAFNNAAFVYAERGEWRQAVDVWERSVEIRSRLPRSLFPNYMEDHNRIGQILLQHGQYERAIAHFEALLKLKPEHEEARRFLSDAHQKSRHSPNDE